LLPDVPVYRTRCALADLRFFGMVATIQEGGPLAQGMRVEGRAQEAAVGLPIYFS
jgi:hypothetical protein